MQISDREEILLEAFRQLPPDAAAELSALAQRLAALAPGTRIDWSDSWSDADLQEFTAASLARLEAEEEEESTETPVMSWLVCLPVRRRPKFAPRS